MENNQLVLANNTPINSNTKIHANADAQIEAGIIASVFGIKLAARLEKVEDTSASTPVSAIRVLVSPAATNPKQEVSFADICKAAKIDVNSLNDVLKLIGFTGGAENTFIDVNQAFYYHSTVSADVITINAVTITAEYALSLAVTNMQPFTSTTPFEINNITFALWNTTRQKVIDSFGMSSISDTLDTLS